MATRTPGLDRRQQAVALATDRVVSSLLDDGTDVPGRRQVPAELADLPTAARRAVQRIDGALGHPSVVRALHDMTVAEVLAERLVGRLGDRAASDGVVDVVSAVLDYLLELSTTKHEGEPVTHGVVITTRVDGADRPQPPIAYPGQLRSRERTPLLFDGTYRALVVSTDGRVLRGVTRSTLPTGAPSASGTDIFDEVTGPEGSLTAAASAVFDGIGVYLRPDQTIWVFDAGVPLFLRRTNRWRPIAIAAFARAIAALGQAPQQVADRVARTALRSSLRGSGALLGIASGPDDLAGQVPDKDVYRRHSHHHGDGGVDDLHRLIGPDDVAAPGALAQLAQLDGATIVDTGGDLLTFGAIVRSKDSQVEGARTAAARILSNHVNVAICVSQDGPITVFSGGDPVLRLL